MQYAIFNAGGAQHKAVQGKKLCLQKLDGEVGQSLTFDDVLMFSNEQGDLIIGQPRVNAQVHVEITRQFKDKKLQIIKFRRRKNSLRRAGHRQPLTEVKVTALQILDGER